MMLDSTTIAGIASIAVGFVLIMSSFACFMYKKPAHLTWGLFAVAIVFLTIIPVTLAVFSASTL